MVYNIYAMDKQHLKNTLSVKHHYLLTYRFALLISILMLTTVFLVAPRFFTSIPLSNSSIIDKQINFIPPPPTTQVEPLKPDLPPLFIPVDQPVPLDNIPIGTIDFGEYNPPTSVELPVPSPTVFISWDKAPIPSGGWSELSGNVIYPPIAMEAKIEGTVIIRFYLDKSGNIKSAFVQLGVPNTGLNEAAMAAIKNTHWEPAYQRDKPVAVWVSQKISFKLN